MKSAWKNTKGDMDTRRQEKLMTLDDTHVPARNDRRLARAGDEAEAHRRALEEFYLPPWVREANEQLAPHGLRIRQLLVWPGSVAAQIVFEATKYVKMYTTPQQPTEEKLRSLVCETLDVIAQMEDPMNIFSTSLFSYISGEMIGDSEVTLTIKDVIEDELTSSRGTEEKPVMTFKEKDKSLVLNKTNAKFMAEKAGKETDNWRGLKIVLHAPYINAFGERMRSVTIKDVLGPSSNGDAAAEEEE